MRGFGGPQVLRVESATTPTVAPGTALVRVAAVAVSRTRDAATRGGLHPFSRAVTLPHVLGGDCAGVVAATGAGVDPTLVGRPVAVMNHHLCGSCPACRRGAEHECERMEMLGIHRWGSYAEYALVHADGLHLVPEDLDLVEAAAMAAAGPLALTQLRAAGVRAGDHVVVPGVTGAVGSTVAALCTVLGAVAVGLSRRAPLQSAGAASGGPLLLAALQPDLADAIVRASGGVRPRAAIDNVCAPAVFSGYWPALAHAATIVVSGAIGDPELAVLPVPARDLYSRSISLLGVRSHLTGATQDFWQLVWDGFRLPAGLLRTWVLEQAAEAHGSLGEPVHGHTVLVVGEGGAAAGGASR